MKIGNREFETGKHTYVMGILNVTPDSFSDGGKYDVLSRAIEHASQMVIDGVDVIDVGGESTRPGYTMISEEEEIERVVPAIKAVKERWDVPVSVDTYKAKVAKAALEAGADMVNDIWGLRYEEEMAEVVKKAGVPVCIMHNRKEADYTDYMEDVFKDMEESLQIAKKAGIRPEQIILDPGIGFAKSYEQNLYMLKHLNALGKFGYPLLLGSSRKSVIGHTLDLPADEREEGTIVTSVLAAQAGYFMVRVHDVKKNARAIKMVEAVRDAE